MSVVDRGAIFEPAPPPLFHVARMFSTIPKGQPISLGGKSSFLFSDSWNGIQRSKISFTVC